MNEWEYLIEILERSIKKNGSKEITTEHLLRMMKMAERKVDSDDCSDLVGMGHED